MDLCLRGSQINLVSRQKAKPKHSSQTSLNSSVYRPRSANLQNRRQRCSPSFCRPQSADPRFGRHYNSCAHYSNDLGLSNSKFGKNNLQHKRLQSLSSSDLFKLLLDEPIKRPWLCRNSAGGLSSPDETSEISSARRSASFTSLIKKNCSLDCSSVEDESFQKSASKNCTSNYLKSISKSPKKEMSSYSSSYSKEKISFSGKSFSKDFWKTSNSSATTITTTNGCFNAVKPDLPGRVSFSKSNALPDLDSSDCDNDKQELLYHYSPYRMDMETHSNSISAPGPVVTNLPPVLSDFSKSSDQASTSGGGGGDAGGGPRYSFSSASKEDSVDLSSHGTKKSVHFGSNGSDGDTVLAETFEYPKCPSENCSCSTRSSSTASLHDVNESKCACDSGNCLYNPDSVQDVKDLGFLSSLDKETFRLDPLTANEETKPLKESSSLEELNVIKAYKEAIGDQLDNSIVKNILEDNKASSPNTTYRHLNNMEKASILEKFSSSQTSVEAIPNKAQEKQNNLSDVKGSGSLYKTNSKTNLISLSSNKADNLDSKLSSKKSSYTSSSESVINNYLKVASSSPFGSKKKENTSPSSAPTSTPLISKKRNKLSPLQNGKGKYSSGKLKKAFSHGNLREDSNLDEFNLDKVDSWISMQVEKDNSKALVKHGSLESDLENYSKTKYELALKADVDGDGDGKEEDLNDLNSQGSSKSDESSQDDSTYDEICSVIKEIEEDKKHDNLAERSCTEMDLNLSASSTARPQSSTREQPKSPDKYKDILSYLDDVEDSCDKTLLETRRSIPESNRSEVEFVIEPDIIEDVPKISDLLLLPNHQLARRVVTLSLRANELANAIHLSKEHVCKIKSEKQKVLRAEKVSGANRLKEQKKQFESIVERHQGFIEQLLKDKGTLCEKVAALTRRLESQNQAWEHKLEVEVSRVKETTMAGEKIRRERWVRENTKKIKELTVKGLETEINNMTCEHQRAITELKKQHQEQLLEALEEARLKHEQIESNIRESCTQDRETIIEKERTAIRERFDRQMEDERKLFEETKQTFLDDFAAERERYQKELRIKELEYQSKCSEMKRVFEQELEQSRNELLEKMSKQDEKYLNRINTIEKQYEADFEVWKRDFENNCKLSQVEKENSIRQHYRAERDRQIDVIVSRMDAEALKASEDFEGKLNRMKEKYEKDLQDAENLEKSLREKFTEMRNKLAESDAQVRNQQAEMKQLQIELEHSKKMGSDYLADRDQLRENIRNEIQNEVAQLKNERDSEIQQIHKRVQQAVEKKDATIDILQKENGSLRERCLKLEAVIRQQRKDYCVK